MKSKNIGLKSKITVNIGGLNVCLEGKHATPKQAKRFISSLVRDLNVVSAMVDSIEEDNDDDLSLLDNNKLKVKFDCMFS